METKEPQAMATLPEDTRSHLVSEAKQGEARLVFGCETKVILAILQTQEKDHPIGQGGDVSFRGKDGR